MPAPLSIVTSLYVIPFAALIALYFNSVSVTDVVEDSIARYGVSLPFASSPRVHDRSSNVTYLGIQSGGVEQYLGIFYAQDTSATNRFAPPKPLFHEPGSIIDARATGAWCPQGTGGPPLPFASAITNISENCLSLGITRPKRATGNAKLPVLVWIHGGGHALGSYADQLYDPRDLVKASVTNKKPVIFIGINYRLGMFGFARSKALVEAGYTNAGLRDQRAAFEWIQQNVASFGGDPDNVISIGQSVGASDTGLHITSYGGEKGIPFNKAVMMSGAPGLTFNIQSDLVDRNTAAVAEQLGCVVDGDSHSTASMKCLQEAPMDKLVNFSVTAARLARPPFGEGYFHPIEDGEYIPDRPSELLRQGRFVKNIPVMASWVTNDGAWYAPPSTTTDDEVTGSFGLWLSNLSQDTLTKLLGLYPESDFEQMSKSEKPGGLSPQYYRAAQMNRDLWFTCPVLDFAHHHALHSTDSISVPTYIYEHNATRFTPVYENIMRVPFWGVSHLSDIPYMLNNDVAAGADNSATAKNLAKEMSSMLIEFAYTSHPDKSWIPAFAPGSLGAGKSRNAEPSLPSEIRLMLFQHEKGRRRSGLVTVGRNVDSGKAAYTSSSEEERVKAVEWEKLFERCDFINSERVREEIGV